MVTFKDVEDSRKKANLQSQKTSKKRKKYSVVIFAIIFPIVTLIFLSFTSNKFSNYGTIGFVSAVIILLGIAIATFAFCVLIAYLSTYKDNQTLAECNLAYKRAYKAFFIQYQLNKLFTDIEYNHELGLDRKFLKEAGIYTGDIFRSNDLVKGKYKNNAFTQADVKIIDKKERRDKDGNIEEYYVTVFAGRYLVFEFPKKFSFKMMVSHTSHGFITHQTREGLSRIETESPDFNKRFLVYAENGPEAFYILNPSFIDNLEKLGTKYDNELALFFSSNKLYVALGNNKDAFEPPSFSEPLNEKTEEKKVLEEMSIITELVDNLKLSKPQQT